MLRLQVPLPDRYTIASPGELDEWIGDAKRSLASRESASPSLLAPEGRTKE